MSVFATVSVHLSVLKQDIGKTMIHRKPDETDIRTAKQIRLNKQEAAEDRDFAIKEAHRQYANHIRYAQQEDILGILMRNWFTATRRKIYHEMRKEYPNLTTEDWKLLHEIMRRYICVQMLLGEVEYPYFCLNFHGAPPLVEVFTASRNYGKVTRECASMIIDSFKMARVMCAGVLTVRVSYPTKTVRFIRVH